jgi:hypothetical protein
MKEYYWYKNDPVFDWNKYEELEDMKDDFGKPCNIFLEAHDDEKIVGVLGFRHRGRLATLRRWEPVTVEPQSDLRIHQELLTYSLNFLSEKGVERVRVLIKHPAKNPKVTGHLLTLFSENDFDRYQPDSIDLMIFQIHLLRIIVSQSIQKHQLIQRPWVNTVYVPMGPHLKI